MSQEPADAQQQPPPTDPLPEAAPLPIAATEADVAPTAGDPMPQPASSAVVSPGTAVPAAASDAGLAGAATSADEPTPDPSGVMPDADSAAPRQAVDQDSASDGALEELTLPATVEAPPQLAADTTLGPDGRLRVGAYLGALGRVNRYASVWQDDEGQAVDVELREGPAGELQREAAVLEAVRYAMLPRWYATFEQGSCQYLVLEQTNGPTVEEALRSGMDQGQAVSVVVQLAQVLRRLHLAGWVLAGLSPADVRLGEPLRVTELGGALRVGETSYPLQVPGYSAPELAHPAPLTGKEDVYSLGAILYHALVGQPLPESGAELAALPTRLRIPGVPQILAQALAVADERADLETVYQQLLAFKQRLGRGLVALDVASATSLGLNPTRLVNEDACGYAVWSAYAAGSVEQGALLCVADGMGGMEAGEVASGAALQAVMAAGARPVRPGDSEPGATALPLDPVALVRGAAPAVHAAGEGRQMGTTLTVVIVQGSELTLGHVGDTRAYLLRSGVLTQLTNDHSLVAAMVASGVLTKDEARGHPDSNKVLRSLGGQRELPDRYVDTLAAAYGRPTLRLQPGDWIMVCSDGIWGSVDEEQIGGVLMEALDGGAAAQALVQQALNAGAPDNATAVVARCVAVADQ